MPSLWNMSTYSCRTQQHTARLTHLVAMTGCTCAALWILRTAILPSLLNFGGVCVWRSTSSLISARADSSLSTLRISFGLLAFKSASHAEMTSNFAVRLAVNLSDDMRSGSMISKLTSVDQGYCIIDILLRVGLERGCHIWKRRLPFQCISQITMSTHRAKIVT